VIKAKIFLGFLTLTLAVCSGSGLAYAEQTVRITYGQSQKENIVLLVTAVPLQDAYVLRFRVSGSGFPPQNVSSPGQRRLLAERAARIDAYRQLLIANKALTGEKAGRNIEGYIRGAEVKKTSYESDGKVRVIVEQSIYEGQEIGGRILRTVEKKLNKSGIFWSKLLQ